MKILKALLWTQSVYYLITAVWPLVDIQSFMQVTGYKTDQWLVKTVGALLVPVAICLGIHLFIRTNMIAAMTLGAGCAIAFLVIDLYYALNDVISDIYLLDGIAQFGFLVWWAIVFFRSDRKHSGHV